MSNYYYGGARRNARTGRAGRTIEIATVMGAIVREILGYEDAVSNRRAVLVERREFRCIEGYRQGSRSRDQYAHRHCDDDRETCCRTEIAQVSDSLANAINPLRIERTRCLVGM